MRLHLKACYPCSKLSQAHFDDDFVVLQKLREALERAWGEYKQASTSEEKREKRDQYRRLLKQFTEEAFRRPQLNAQPSRRDSA